MSNFYGIIDGNTRENRSQDICSIKLIEAVYINVIKKKNRVTEIIQKIMKFMKRSYAWIQFVEIEYKSKRTKSIIDELGGHHIIKGEPLEPIFQP